MNGEIKEILFQRKLEDLSRDWIPREEVLNTQEYSIVVREDWFGLVYGKDKSIVFLPTIFDAIEVSIYGNSLFALCRIEDVWGAYWIDLYSPQMLDLSKPIIELEFSHISVNLRYGSAILYKNELQGLFSLNDREFVLYPIYQQVTEVVANRYLWVKNKSGRFLFVDKKNKKEIYPISPIMVYDCCDAMLFELKDNRIYMSDEKGVVDKLGFRKLLYENSGRFQLVNTRYDIIKKCDIYGYIIG